MSRISGLKQFNEHLFKVCNTKSYRYRHSRYQTVNRFIRTLAAVRNVPNNWHCLTIEQVHLAIRFWRVTKKETTVAKYIAQIRSFLEAINHPLRGIDNQSLNIVIKPQDTNTRFHSIPVEDIRDPLIKHLFLLQTEFGLTFSESIAFRPDIHLKENCLWLTREMTRTSRDRVVPIVTKQQKNIVQWLANELAHCESASSLFGYGPVRIRFSFELKRMHLNSAVHYRFIYAKNRAAVLLQEMSKEEANLKLRAEMGISAPTLRRLLSE